MKTNKEALKSATDNLLADLLTLTKEIRSCKNELLTEPPTTFDAFMKFKYSLIHNIVCCLPQNSYTCPYCQKYKEGSTQDCDSCNFGTEYGVCGDSDRSLYKRMLKVRENFLTTLHSARLKDFPEPKEEEEEVRFFIIGKRYMVKQHTNEPSECIFACTTAIPGTFTVTLIDLKTGNRWFEPVPVPLEYLAMPIPRSTLEEIDNTYIKNIHITHQRTTREQ